MNVVYADRNWYALISVFLAREKSILSAKGRLIANIFQKANFNSFFEFSTALPFFHQFDHLV